MPGPVIMIILPKKGTHLLDFCVEVNIALADFN